MRCNVFMVISSTELFLPKCQPPVQSRSTFSWHRLWQVYLQSVIEQHNNNKLLLVMLATESNNDDTDSVCFMSSFFWVGGGGEGGANGNLVLLLPCMVMPGCTEKARPRDSMSVITF